MFFLAEDLGLNRTMLYGNSIVVISAFFITKLFKSHNVVWKPRIDEVITPKTITFKSHNVVWKHAFECKCVKLYNTFKSHNVVWKHKFKQYNLEHERSLNRTMLYGNYSSMCQDFHRI